MEQVRYVIQNNIRLLKNLYFIRYMAKPFKDFFRNRRHAHYVRTADYFYLRTLRNIHAGQRCFILGNGPSLTASDCNKLVGEITFAANRIYKLFESTKWRPTYYMSIDKDFLASNARELEKQEMGHMFIANYSKHKFNGALNKVTRIFCERLDFDVNLKEWNDLTAYISEEVPHHICAGHTVTFYAIQMAIYMGFKEIYLLGVDNRYSVWLDENGRIEKNKNLTDYFDGKRYLTNTLFAPTSINYAYEAAREYCDTHGITIKNATRGGNLDIFERVDFDELMSLKERGIV